MRTLAFFCILAFISCDKTFITKETDTSSFSSGKNLGRIDSRLKEGSGIAASLANKDMIWTHNDSGNSNEIFLIDKTGKVIMSCSLGKTVNRDWEDIAVGPGPDTTKTYVYVGDIGDNASKYKEKFIYRFEEPLFDTTRKEISVFDTITVTLSDKSRDTEAMMLDPTSKDIYLVSKWEDSVGLYQLKYPFNKTVNEAIKVSKIGFNEVTSGAISVDGNEVLIKTYVQVYYWKKKNNESIVELLHSVPEILPYESEGQGEAITFDLSGEGYYTLSETTRLRKANLMFYKRK